MRGLWGGLWFAGMLAAICGSAGVQAEEWVPVGADPQGKFYVDRDSIEVDGETLRFRKKGVYNFRMLETFGDKKISFQSSIGLIELDCGRRIHRMVRMDVLSPEGDVAWTTGKLNRLWEDIAPNTLGEETRKFVCETMAHS